MALDADTVERLLDGHVTAEDAPQGYGPVVSVLRAADVPARLDEARADPDHIRRIFEQARRGPAPAVAPGPGDHRRSALSRSARAAIVAVVATFTIGGGVAMAATGTLPGAIQGSEPRARCRGRVGAGRFRPVRHRRGAHHHRVRPRRPPPNRPPPPPTHRPTRPPSRRRADPRAGPVGDPHGPDDVIGLPGSGRGGLRGSQRRAVPGRENGKAGDPNPSDTRPGSPDEPTGPPTTKDNPSVTRPSGPKETTEPTIVDPPPTNPSETNPGKGPK